MGGVYAKPDSHLTEAVARVLVAKHGGRVRGDEVRAYCPLHVKSLSRSFALNKSRGVWQCFKCGERGHLVGLARRLGLLRGTETGRRLALDIQSATQAARWRGMSGATDREVLLALATIAIRIGSVDLSCSDRQVAELAAVGRKTARRSLRRLASQGWLTQTSTGEGRQASSYRLHLPQAHQVDPNRVLECPLGANGVNLVQGDVARWRALGKNSRLLLGSLRTGEWRVADLARAVGLHRNTVSRLLRKCEPFGLVLQTEAGTWTAGNIDRRNLDALAKHYGTLGDGERARSQHEQERLVYRVRVRPIHVRMVDHKGGAR